MLHYPTIDTATLELLKQLMSLPGLAQMRLVGGTALALQIGHRNSVDLDFFGKIETDEYAISKMVNMLGEARILKKSSNIYIYLINNIKVDLVNYPYTWIDDVVVEDGIRLAAKKDIAAMKLSAITGRGSKKDFIDLFFLLREYTLEEMLEFYQLKYPDGSVFLVLKSISYFEDAEKNEMPRMFTNVTWPEVKGEIIEALNRYLKSK